MAFPDTTAVEAARPEVRRIRKRSGPTWPIPAMNALLGVLLWCTPVASQTTAELPGQDRPLQVSVEELFRVGQLDGREWEMLTYVHSVSFDARGRLYVFDPMARSLVRVGRDGAFEQQFIRSGDGPGEVSFPGAVGVERDGTVLIVDRGRRHYYWFAPDGTLTGSLPLETAPGPTRVPLPTRCTGSP